MCLPPSITTEPAKVTSNNLGSRFRQGVAVMNVLRAHVA